ncbi:MAG: sulfite exporter TauE/SafE family protein [Verrucomicrobia bacterium]|nr:sulfite exporter TauE/SafE family protein [Verrucomicrobiota bacterium]
MTLTITQAVILAVVGLASGFLNVLAGGGSLLTLPTLIFMGFSGTVANGTNRVGVLAQNILATAGFMRKGYSDWRMSTSLALATIPGAVIGACLGASFEGLWFNRLLAILMIIIMIVTARPKPKPSLHAATPEDERRRLILAHVWMLFIGFYGGFIQAGIGFVLMAVLYRGLGLDLVRVNMHKVIIVGILTIVAILIFAAHGKIDWLAAAVLAAGNALGGWIGAHAAVRHGERLIRIVLNATLLIMAAKLLFTH